MIDSLVTTARTVGAGSSHQPSVERTIGARGQIELLGTVAAFDPLDVKEEADLSEPRDGIHEVFRISGALPGGHWLQDALPVNVSLEQGEFVAHQPHTDLSAFGETAVGAVYALRQELVDTLLRLEAAGDRLAPRLARQRTLLHCVINSPSDAQH